MSGYLEHYEALLAPIYVWMAGGLDAALSTGANDVAELVPGRGLAVDLGAGFGMHSVPLARGGYDVVAIDTSSSLLQVLETSRGGLPIRTVTGDLLDFRRHVPGPASLIVCMGDTLTHLDRHEQVTRLCRDVREALGPGGRFVATFRDYTSPPGGDRRFIPVRSDPDRILTCFLEEGAGHVTVHDLLHERADGGWRLAVSSYRKLRLSPSDVEAALRAAGLDARTLAGPRGMVRVDATA